jgi:DNA-binding GntR family transcriptional regulator
MPKHYGVKEKDHVVEHIINLILSGRLRTGDRIDRAVVTRDLGVSRIPVQEAILQLEHDGILSTRYHRGAFVERIDEASIREHHEIYGVLSAIPSAAAAAMATPSLLAALDASMLSIRNAKDPSTFHRNCWDYRNLINDEYAGPRLRAAIRASQCFAPSDFWLNYPAGPVDFLPSYEVETAAIHQRDPDAARAVCIRRADLMAEIMLAGLKSRGVLDRSG